MARSYKIRRFQNGKSSSGKPFFNYSLTVPTEIALKLPDDQTYECELVERGILFVPSGSNEPVDLPEWAQRKPIENGTPKPKREGGRKKPGVKAKA
jgi:hypothetical protein